MKLSFTNALLLLTTSTNASLSLSPRASTATNIYICTNPNWAGTCMNMAVTAGKCYNIPAAFDKNVSSTGPDEGTFCTLHSWVHREASRWMRRIRPNVRMLR
jgi:hypothetical protein